MDPYGSYGYWNGFWVRTTPQFEDKLYVFRFCIGSWKLTDSIEQDCKKKTTTFLTTQLETEFQWVFSIKEAGLQAVLLFLLVRTVPDPKNSWIWRILDLSGTGYTESFFLAGSFHRNKTVTFHKEILVNFKVRSLSFINLQQDDIPQVVLHLNLQLKTRITYYTLVTAHLPNLPSSSTSTSSTSATTTRNQGTA